MWIIHRVNNVSWDGNIEPRGRAQLDVSIPQGKTVSIFLISSKT